MGTSAYDQSATAASNTSVGGVSIAEGMAPSGVNDGMRAIIAQYFGTVMSVVAGSTDTYTATLAPAPAALTDGMTIQIRFTNSNTVTTPTLNINSLGAKTIKKLGGSALVVGDIPAAHDAILRYVSASTYWQLLNPANTLADASNGGLVVTANTIAVKPSDLAAKSTRALADSVVIDDVAGAANGKKQLITAVLSGMPIQTVFSETSGVSTGTTTIPIDDTIPQNTEGDQYLSLAITPTATNSTLLIEVVLFAGLSSANQFSLALFQDTTANALAAGLDYVPAGGTAIMTTLSHKMAAGTTSATTFKVRAGGTTGTMTVNGQAAARLFGGVAASMIRITEYLA